MDDEGFHIGDVRQQGEQPHGIREPLRPFLAALGLESEYGSGAVGEVLLVQRMVGVVREAWMVDLLDLRMLAEEFDDADGVVHMPLDPQGQGLQGLDEHE